MFPYPALAALAGSAPPAAQTLGRAGSPALPQGPLRHPPRHPPLQPVAVGAWPFPSARADPGPRCCRGDRLGPGPSLCPRARPARLVGCYHLAAAPCCGHRAPCRGRRTRFPAAQRAAMQEQEMKPRSATGSTSRVGLQRREVIPTVKYAKVKDCMLCEKEPHVTIVETRPGKALDSNLC